MNLVRFNWNAWVLSESTGQCPAHRRLCRALNPRAEIASRMFYWAIADAVWREADQGAQRHA